MQGGGHNDLNIKFRKTYIKKLADFLNYIKDMKKDKSEIKLKEKLIAKDWNSNFKHIYTKYLYEVEYEIETKNKINNNNKKINSMNGFSMNSTAILNLTKFILIKN